MPIVRSMESEFQRKFRVLRAQVIDVVGKRNALRLVKGRPGAASVVTVSSPRPLTKDADPPSFEYSLSSDKIQAFMEWLKQMEDEGIFLMSQGEPISSAVSKSWMNTYIDTTYRKGLRDGYSALTSAGADLPEGYSSSAFLQPVHADAVGVIYSRTYNELTGITDVMDQRISRVLASGIANGEGAMSVARNIADQVEGIGLTRARTLARTELVNAYSEATLNTYEDAGLSSVELMAEFSTAGDDQVCPECEDLDGQVMSISEARGLIPRHPRCRCSWLPVVDN
jgi:SPP1 gp7 family putative phage head morphogenesis protein